jgi:iron complex outermembrane receptor protein
MKTTVPPVAAFNAFGPSALTALLLSSVASPALAQQQAPAPGAAKTASQEQAGLAEIVVTATKRETNLQKTPIAISVANTQALTDRHASSLLDLGDGSIPSLRVATFEARQSALTVGIRGIVPFDANQTARDQGVGVYVDGIYLGRQQGLNAALLDIERIEVLRGPQGTLFGRNTEGGAVSIVTKAPTGVFGIRGKIGVGNYGSREGELHVDLPAFANVAVKLDGIYDHQGATVKNPLAGQYGWNYHNVVGGRASARWTPVDGLTVDLSYDRSKDENTPNYSQLITYNPNGYNVGSYVNPTTGVIGSQLYFNGAACSPTAATNPCIRPLSPLVVVSGDKRQKVADIGVPQAPSSDRTDGFSGTIKYKVTPNLELRSITGFRQVGTHQWDNSGGAHRTTYAPNTIFSRYSLSELYQHQFSQELQAVGNIAGQVDYVLGGYYFHEKATELAATPNTDRWNADGTAYTILSENGNGIPFSPTVCSNPSVNGIVVPNQGWDRDNWCVQRDSHARATSYAAFGQATWTPVGLDILHLTAGARWTKDKRTGVLDVVQGKTANFVFNYDQDRVDPLFTVAVDASRTVHFYAKYASGFRAGGANDRSKTFTAFGPETVKSFEVGSKMDLFDHKARLNLATYMMRRKGTQTDFDNVDTDPTSPTFGLHTEETRNAPGTSKIKGIEADLTVRPTAYLTLGASYTYTDIKVPPTPNPFIVGNPLFQVYTVFTPKNAASAFADYEIPTEILGGKIRAHLDASYAGRQYSFQAEPVKTDSSFIVNGRLALADMEMNGGGALVTFALWSRNLLNETHIYRRSAANSVPAPTFSSATGAITGATYSGVLGDYGNLNPPRTFGAELSFKIGAPRAVPAYVPPPAPAPAPVLTVTCADGTIVTPPGTCPVPAPVAPPPAPVERGQRGE